MFKKAAILTLTFVFIFPLIAESYTFTQNLSMGSRGEEVKRLQEYLKYLGFFDYPSITGYFGPITEVAVQAFQKENGVISFGSPNSTGYGRVGPLTRSTLNLGSVVSSPDSPSKSSYTWTPRLITRRRGSIPPAPTPNLSDSDDTEDLADTNAPEISDISSGTPSDTSVTITWTTNEAGDSQIEYGLTNSYGQSTTLDEIYTMSHSVELSGLNENTIYHYRVLSRDAAGNLTTSIDQTFTTEMSDFTFIVAGDPHLNVSTGEVADWNRLTDWIVNNQSTENIQAVLIKGDFGGFTSGEWAAQDLANSWSNGDPAKGIVNVDALNIPWVSAIGNHDYEEDDEASRDTTTFDAQIGYSRLSTKDWFEDYYDDGTNSKATYTTRFQIGSKKFIVVVLELFPRVSAMQWAINQLDNYPDHYGIIVTHAYQKPDGNRIVDSDIYGPNAYNLGSDLSGEEMWDYLQRKSNVMMVLSGHYLGTPRASYLASTGENGNITHQIYANYQELTPDANGLVKLRFSPADNLVYVSDLDLETGLANSITPYSFAFDQPTTDATAPTLSGISSSAVSDGATISWATSEPSDSQIQYGLTDSYGSETILNTSMTLSHSVIISNLNPGTLYHYRILSRDAAGNLVTSTDKTLTTATESATMESTSAFARNVAPGVEGSIYFGQGGGTFRQLGDISIGFWLKLSSDTDFNDHIAGYLVSGETQDTNATFFVWTSGTSNAWDLEIGHEYGAGINHTSTFNTNITNGVWRYIGISRDATAKTYSVWVGDGNTLTSHGSWTYTTSPDGGTSANSQLTLFKLPNGIFQFLDGASISEFAYHSHALSEAEHAAQMSGVVPLTNLLVRMPVTGGSPELDASGNGYSGILSNTTVVTGPHP